MLSRVADRLYWTGRYLDRVENTARLAGVYTNLLLDMPPGVNIGWYNLITLNNAERWFDSRYKIRDERNVMKFLLADPDYPGSMLNSLQRVRENLRTSRDVVPAESWEYINELALYVQENLNAGINRGQRHEFIANVIKSCQQLLGLFESAMSEGQGKSFLRMGRYLETADMTTRILDAGVGLQLENQDDLLPSTESIIWANVLHSLSAYLPYTKSQRASVRGPRVARFLLEDEALPHALRHACLMLREICATLPRNSEVLECVDALIDHRFSHLSDDQAQLDQSFSTYLNDLQVQLADLHRLFAETWFSLD